jgi:hypothetical protein
MIEVISSTRYMPGTKRRQIYMYEDDDLVMTDSPIYESAEDADAREDEELDKLLELFDDT